MIAVSLIADADFVVAHYAAFARPFVEARLPDAAEGRWVCTMTDVEWADHGFAGRSLLHLLSETGWFVVESGAAATVNALLHLLDHTLPSGETVLSTAVTQAAHSSWRVEAAGAPFEAGSVLQERGYRWSPRARLWSREVPADVWRLEAAWVALEVYGGLGGPNSREITWRERHA